MDKRMVALAFAALALQGCWGEVGSIFPDGGADTGDTDTGPDPVLYPGGGVGGGPIAGHLSLYFIDEATGAAIAGAKVMVGDDPSTALVGETSADGLVVFDDPALSGPVDVHAFADGHVLESTLALAWANATLLLRPVGWSATGGTATVAGTVTGFDALPEPGATQYRVVKLHYGETRASLLSFRGRDFDPWGGDTAELRPDTEGGAFSLEVPARPGALYALAGVVETFGTSSTMDDTTDWVLLGVAGGLAPEPGETVSPIDVPLDTPLSVDVKVVLAAIPTAFEYKEIFLGLDLGARGTAWLEPVLKDDEFRFTAPLPTGDYADAGPLLVGAAEQIDPAPDAGQLAELPRSFVFDRGFTSWLGYEDLPWALDEPLPAPVALAWDGTSFTCLPTAGRTSSQLVVSDAATGVELWRVTAWDDLPGSIPYPSLPAGWDAPAVPAGGVAIEVFTDTLAEGTSELKFDDFSGVVTTRVLAGAVIE
jgi:hypothetical protein